MKKLFYLAGLLIIMASCNQKTISDSVKIEGTIINPVEKFVLLADKDRNIDTLYLNEENVFSKEFKLTEEAFYTLVAGKENTGLYLIPGADITLSIDTKEFDESIKYEGFGAENCSYLAAKMLFNEENGLNRPNYNMFMKDVAGFTHDLDSINNLKESFINNYEHLTKLSKNLVEVEKATLVYNKANMLNNYPSYHAYFAKVDASTVEADFSEQLAGIELENEKYLLIPDYQQYISMYAYNNPKEDIAYAEKSDPQTIYVLLGVNENFKNETIKNHLLFQNAKQALEYNGAEKFKDVLPVFNQLSTNEENKTSIKDLFTEYSALMAGNPSPIFTGKYMDGKEVTLKDFKGQYVYVDVWATWCGPCKGEIPHLVELEKEYHDRNIAFVSLSVDTDYDAWVKMVTEKDLQGHQIFADNNWKNDFVTGYKINGIPQFVFIDMEGNIITANAPRPSAAEGIRTLFEEQKNL